tara:strand:+ start:540 stop:926 length:387 start_codon:yes stop_codon:yes gene_type:complete
MVRPKIRKTFYWHKVATLLLEHGLMPKDINTIMKRLFPQANINGRHIGAFKRRLIDDGLLDKNLPKTISPNEGMHMAEGLVGAEDQFIYDCVIGSQKRTLKCYEYKLTMLTVEDDDDIEEWLGQINGD